jgi:hypothetical protein
MVKRTPSPVRIRFSGTYAFRMQGWLRATDDGDGSFFPSGRPEQQKPVVVAGFQLPASTPPPDITNFPQRKINAGYIPYALIGEIAYLTDGTASGWHRVGIGGNSDGTMHEIEGTYKLVGNSGTYTVVDKTNDESATYGFVLTDDDNEIEFMDLGSQKGSTGGFGVTAIGVQRRTGDASKPITPSKGPHA